jgi:hypothetical protein
MIAPFESSSPIAQRSSACRRGKHMLSWLVLLALSAVIAACGNGVVEPGAAHSRIVLDVRALTGALAALGDGASVVQDVELRVSANDINVLTLTATLGPTDSIAELDVELDPGTYQFSVSVLSNKDTLLYVGATTARVPEAFPIVIVPEARTAVMIVSPRAGTAQQPLVVRNVGSHTLRWNLQCVQLAGGACITGAQFTFPAQDSLPPGAEQFLEDRFSTGQWQLTFDSPQGTVTVSTTR